MELSDDLLCLFNAGVEERSDSFVVEVPQREIDVGDISPGDVYRVVLLSSEATTTDTADTSDQDGPAPPVENGDVLDVEIEDLGEQGDGIARVGPGYVVIVPDTELGERLTVEITEARTNVAFADIVERYDQ